MGSNLAIFVLLVGCSNTLEAGPGGLPDVIAPSDTNTPADTSGPQDTGNPQDTGSLVDTTDTGPPPDTSPTFCDTTLSNPAVGSTMYGQCISGIIDCGETIEGNNAGGSTHYNRPMYEDWHCASTESINAHYDGPERVYWLELPPGSDATVLLEKECDKDLEMRIFKKSENDICPQSSNNLVFCERDAAAGRWDNQDVRLMTTNNGGFYEIVVDGRNDAVGNFRLSVTCR